MTRTEQIEEEAMRWLATVYGKTDYRGFMDNTKRPREFWIIEEWDPVICKRITLDEKPDFDLNKTNVDIFHVREVTEGELTKCMHPKEKIQGAASGQDIGNRKYYFQCECGTKVQPASFEVVE